MNRLMLFLCSVAVLVSAACRDTQTTPPTPTRLDLVILNGWLVDGTGNPAFRADVGVSGGKIVTIGRLDASAGTKAVDASGLIVSPGFIDIHSHSDQSLLVNRRAESVIRQGWTTLVNGNCGRSGAPSERWPTLDAYLREFENGTLSINLASFVGHNTARESVMGMDNRLATPAELESMKAAIANGMKDGAIGMSVGLTSTPGVYSDTNELVELTKVVAQYGGLNAWHQRGEGRQTWVPSIMEALEVAEKGGARLQFSHITPYYPNWGRQQEAIDLLEAARARGIDVTTDLPPYLRGSDPLSAVVPEALLEGGSKAAAERLKSPENRARVRTYLLSEKEKHRLPEAGLLADGLADHIYIKTSAKHPELVGKSLAEVASLRGRDAIDVAIDLFIEAEGEVGLLTEFRREDDVQMLLVHPLALIEEDEAASAPYGELGETLPHPRTYGTAPMVFRKYVRGEAADGMPGEQPKKLLTVEEAVRKMTSFPAQRLGLTDRGLLREGMWADIVVFDAKTIRDRATWARPHQYPEGISYVFVNGVLVVDQGEHTGAFPGKVVRGPGYAK